MCVENHWPSIMCTNMFNNQSPPASFLSSIKHIKNTETRILLWDRGSQKWHNLAQKFTIKKHFGEQRQVFALSFKKIHDLRWEGEGELASLVRCVTELHVTKHQTTPEKNHNSLHSWKKKTIVSENVFTDQQQFTESISHVSVASVQQISKDVTL